jgi:hypothetical protein
MAGDIYTWTDDQGVVHYTDDPSTIPAKSKAKTTRGAEIGSLPARPAAEPGRQDVSVEADQLDEQYWRSAFADLRQRIADLEKSLRADRKTLADTPSMLWRNRVPEPNPEYEQLKQRVQDEEDALKQSKAQIDDLDHQASKQGVPREWRK